MLQTATKTQSLFSLRQQNQNCYLIGITHSFQIQNSTNVPNISSTKHMINPLPMFNYDRCFFTPSFILNSDDNYYKMNKQFEKQKFSDKIRDAKLEQSVEIDVDISPMNKFCQLCKQDFKDYGEHINERNHVRIQNQSLGNKYIKEVIKEFNNKNKSIKKEEKYKKNKKIY